MSRPLRIEFAGAVYHVSARGNAGQSIFLKDGDRRQFLDLLGREVSQHRWLCHGYCLLDDQYRLIIETPEANLGRGMGRLNAVYSQWFNRRYDRVGHLFQGRYKAILVQKEAYLLELTRYVLLNPLRARMVESLDDWPWSSFPCAIGQQAPPPWLDTDWLLGQFATQRSSAHRRFREFLMAGQDLPSPILETRHQLLLGDKAFVEGHRQATVQEGLREVSKAQRRAVALSLEEYQERHPSRDRAMAEAYLSGAYTMAEIGRHFAVHYMTVSRAVRKFEQARQALSVNKGEHLAPVGD